MQINKKTFRKYVVFNLRTCYVIKKNKVGIITHDTMIHDV